MAKATRQRESGILGVFGNSLWVVAGMDDVARILLLMLMLS